MTVHIEPLLVAALKAQFPTARLCTETPADLATTLPVIQVVGIGGSGDAYQFDTPRADIDVYDGDHDSKLARTNARDLAQQVHDWLLRDLPGTSLGSAFVLEVNEFMSPVWTPYDNTDVRRFTLSAGFRLHDRSAA